MDVTPLQQVTLCRLVAGTITAETASRRALRWLRRYGLVDADHRVTDEGRAYLQWLQQERRRRAANAARERPHRSGNPDPAAGMREAIRRWKRGDRDG
ncbi:hypothetical protein PP1_031155 [Pseudonocardia sp. P1]|nr:hypothetical protein Ae707Ps1_6032c [Pseudonocardia sp. Ae707_Ps1]